MKKIIQIMIAAIFMIILQTSALSCTIFSANDGTMTLAGNNGDYSDPDTYIVFYPAETGKYGRVYAGWKQFWWQTGMNDQGLFFASASTSYLKVQNSTQKPRPTRYLMYICMEQCSNVQEVLEIFDQYNLDFLENMQLMVCDSTGESVIIEGDPIHIKQNYYQVVTNFRLSQTNPPYPCWRYNTAISMFENTSTISPEFFKAVCNATHQEGAFPTQFSTVCNLQEQIIYLYWQHNYEQVKIFNLTEELQSGYHIYSIPALFNISQPPLSPTIDGPRIGKKGQSYNYSFVSVDPDNDDLHYFIDWGDNSNTGWIGPFDSGTEINLSHSWVEKGTYLVIARAKDPYNAESLEATLEVTMPRTRATYSYMFLRFREQFSFLERLLSSFR